jgi:hypothetical protein
MKISQLPIGTRFLYPDLGKTAVLVGLGSAGARVQFDGARRQVEFQVKSGDEVVGDVAFEAPGRPVLVSDYSDVEVVP